MQVSSRTFRYKRTYETRNKDDHDSPVQYIQAYKFKVIPDNHHCYNGSGMGNAESKNNLSFGAGVFINTLHSPGRQEFTAYSNNYQCSCKNQGAKAGKKNGKIDHQPDTYQENRNKEIVPDKGNPVHQGRGMGNKSAYCKARQECPYDWFDTGCTSQQA